MKKILVMAFAIVAAFSMTSCKSSKTLSDATTVASPVDEVTEVAPALTYTTPSRNNSTPAATAPTTTYTKPTVGAGDRQERVAVVNSAEAGLLRDYNVVVGAFSNKANAENFKNKMKQRGFNAFLVQNESGLYRVVAASYDNRVDAVNSRDNIRSTYANDDPGTCPAAWLLIPSR